VFAAAYDRTNPRNQFFYGKRLFYIVVGTHFEQQNFGLNIRPGAQSHEGYVRGRFPDLLTGSRKQTQGVRASDKSGVGPARRLQAKGREGFENLQLKTGSQKLETQSPQ